MPNHSSLSTEFLADLAAVYPNAVERLSDRTTLSAETLVELGQHLQQLRVKTQSQLRALLDGLPEDDPIFCPVSLFGTIDLGRLETAHTRTLAWLFDPQGEHGFGKTLLAA